MQGRDTVRLVMAEDDEDDQMLVKRAFLKARLVNTLDVVEDGEELLDYLYRRGKHANAQRPDLILLDINMPRKGGKEALMEMKADPKLRSIPVVMLTSSSADEDILRSYDLGASSYVQKPVTFERLVEIVQSLANYWFEIVKLPENNG